MKNERSPKGPSLAKEPSAMIWRNVSGFEDYEVSEYGDLRRGSKYLKPERVQGSGRKRFALSRSGRVFRFKAAQLVALAFIGPQPFDDAEVAHNDGFIHNNHYSNLRWDTHTGNEADKLKHENQKRDHSGLHVPPAKELMASANELIARAAR